MLSESGVFTRGRAESFLVASHITRSRYACQVTAAVLYFLLKKAYAEDEIRNNIDFDDWCHIREKESCQFKFWYTVLQLQVNILCLIRSFRESSFQSYIKSLQVLAPWFFLLNRTHYKRWLPFHIKDMLELSKKHPSVYLAFSKGFFTGQKTKNRFSAIPLDQIHEQENIKIKGIAGAASIIEKEKALDRWMIAGPEVSNILEDFEAKFAPKTMDLKGYHHDEGVSVQLRFKAHVERLTSVWEDKGNPFAEKESGLINIFDRKLAHDEVIQFVYTMEDLGKTQYKQYVQSVIVKKNKSVWDTLPTNKLKLYGFSPASPTVAKHSAITLLKKSHTIFNHFLINAQVRPERIDDFFTREILTYPPSLSVNGAIRFGTKSDIVKLLLPYQSSSTDSPHSNVQVKVFDGAAIVQSLGFPSSIKTFLDYKTYFWAYINRLSVNCFRIDVVFDRYIPNSLKQSTRSKRGTSAAVSFKALTVLPNKWHDFLRNSTNKSNLFEYLVQSGDGFSCNLGQVVIATYLKEALVLNSSNQTAIDMRTISPSDHEEADSRMFLHCHHASQAGFKHVLIHSVDSDVVVLAVALFEKLQLDTLWIRYGVGKHVKYIASHEIALRLGKPVSSGLPFFHAFSGCDNVSAFERHGKTSFWKTWRDMPELNGVFSNLSEPVDCVNDENQLKLEHFISKLYFKDNTNETCLDDVRKTMIFQKVVNHINFLLHQQP